MTLSEQQQTLLHDIRIDLVRVMMKYSGDYLGASISYDIADILKKYSNEEVEKSLDPKHD